MAAGETSTFFVHEIYVSIKKEKPWGQASAISPFSASGGRAIRRRHRSLPYAWTRQEALYADSQKWFMMRMGGLYFSPKALLAVQDSKDTAFPRCWIGGAGKTASAGISAWR